MRTRPVGRPLAPEIPGPRAVQAEARDGAGRVPDDPQGQPKSEAGKVYVIYGATNLPGQKLRFVLRDYGCETGASVVLRIEA